jgi:Ca2+-binding RTX toxin-like protein
MAAANTPPTVDLDDSASGTGTSLAVTENDRAAAIAPNGFVLDPDGDFEGGTLTVAITAGADTSDRLQVLEGIFTVSEQDILYEGTRIGTIAGGNDPSAPLVVRLNNQANGSVVDDLIRSIGFANYSDAPSEAARTIAFTVTDGHGGTSNTATATVTLTATDDPAEAQPDQISTDENEVATGSVFDDTGYGPDTDPDGTITVSQVNGGDDVGKTIELASGALLTVNSDGTYAYDPNHAFDYLVGGTGAANSQAVDSFQYTVAGGNEVTATVTVNGVYSPGEAELGTSADDVIEGTGNKDLFDVSQGGDDSVGGRDGDDYFYFGGGFSPEDRVDGGPGYDVVALLGNYDLTLNPTSLVRIERLTLFSGPSLGGTEHVSYHITTNDGNVARGESLEVLAASLLPDETLTFNGLAEKDGKFQVFGGAGNDSIAGGQQGDDLVGNDGDDSLYGMGGNDFILGGAGADYLRGGFGSDLFVFRSADDSTARVFDTIADFEQTRDHIDVHEIDANPEAGGDQAFTFIGSDAFSHNAGELRAYQLEGSTWAVEGDLNGDGTADLYVQVNLASPTSLVASDFVL